MPLKNIKLLFPKKTAPAEKGLWSNSALTKLLWPLIVEQTLAIMMGFADTAMVSSVGEFAVSGVHLVDQFATLLITAFTAFATGGAVVVSQYIGRKDPVNASLAACQLVYINMAASLLIGFVCFAFCRPLIALIYGSIGSDVSEAAAIYFRISALSYPFLALYNATAAILRAMKKTRVTMIIALLVNLMNIGGNAVFIFGLKAGVAGAALSTLLARSAAALLTLRLLTKEKTSVNLQGLFRFRLSRQIAFSILGVGVPSGIENSMFQIGKVIVARIITSFGTAAIAANAIAGVVNSFSYMIGQAFSMALLTVTGQCIGARAYSESKRLTKKMLFLCSIAIWVTSALIVIFMKQITGLFSLSEESARICRVMLTVYAVFAGLAWPSSFCLPSALRAAGDARFCMTASAITMFTIRVSSSFFFCYTLKLGAPGIFYAMGCDFIFRAAIYTLRWRSDKWMTKTVLRD